MRANLHAARGCASICGDHSWSAYRQHVRQDLRKGSLNMSRPQISLSYVNLFCRDIDAAFAFYDQLVGLDEILESRSPMFRGARTGGASIGFSAFVAYEVPGLY